MTTIIPIPILTPLLLQLCHPKTVLCLQYLPDIPFAIYLTHTHIHPLVLVLLRLLHPNRYLLIILVLLHLPTNTMKLQRRGNMRQLECDGGGHDEQ